MTVRRYSRTPIINGNMYGSCYIVSALRTAIKNNQINFETIILQQRERLDTLSSQIYGDGKLWWILAAGSDIGFGLQVPAGTIIRVPNIEQVSNLAGE